MNIQRGEGGGGGGRCRRITQRITFMCTVLAITP